MTAADRLSDPEPIDLAALAWDPLSLGGGLRSRNRLTRWAIDAGVTYRCAAFATIMMASDMDGEPPDIIALNSDAAVETAFRKSEVIAAAWMRRAFLKGALFTALGWWISSLITTNSTSLAQAFAGMVIGVSAMCLLVRRLFPKDGGRQMKRVQASQAEAYRLASAVWAFSPNRIAAASLGRTHGTPDIRALKDVAVAEQGGALVIVDRQGELDAVLAAPVFIDGRLQLLNPDEARAAIRRRISEASA